ncbi:tripartite tricarboxylate transporter TctB family protein [Puniceibacterium sp. IMCC21224]|uniref:tripartite tricarboxylate transporter TctB family protein n=1 Tax=Puniceibacterium sp. IMCC21224 TaxID=1618204 RepID=UPI00064DB2E1|nr:tripartite tricarboxylate transporter TctB family protein [Puniceibacterium sp. IMCC21224]KMK65214.1 Tripartite tricarboxylate transporter TctB family [Puniceibacterium sp. IMCC21224]
MGSLTQVTIDFDKSHLVFPTIIACVLGLLGVTILLTRYRRIAHSGGNLSAVMSGMDKPRFLGTLVLTLIYFSAMVPVGDFWPNTGRGFLICSIPYVLLTGLLFMHDRTLRNAVPLIVVSLIAPTLIWYLFTELFFLTLP